MSVARGARRRAPVVGGRGRRGRRHARHGVSSSGERESSRVPAVVRAVRPSSRDRARGPSRTPTMTVASSGPDPRAARRRRWVAVVTWYLSGARDHGGVDARQGRALRGAWQGDLPVAGPIAVAVAGPRGGARAGPPAPAPGQVRGSPVGDRSSSAPGPGRARRAGSSTVPAGCLARPAQGRGAWCHGDRRRTCGVRARRPAGRRGPRAVRWQTVRPLRRVGTAGGAGRAAAPLP